MPQDGRQLGSSAYVHGLRQGGLLQFIQKSPCHGSLPRRWASDHAFDRTRGRLALVLHRRDFSQLASALSLMRMSATLETMSAVPSSIRVVMTSPAKKTPRATATTGLTYAWLATRGAGMRPSSHTNALKPKSEPAITR